MVRAREEVLRFLFNFRVSRVFEFFDRNLDNKISLKEFKAGLDALYDYKQVVKPSDALVEAAFKALDVNGDGSLSIQELQEGFRIVYVDTGEVKNVSESMEVDSESMYDDVMVLLVNSLGRENGDVVPTTFLLHQQVHSWNNGPYNAKSSVASLARRTLEKAAADLVRSELHLQIYPFDFERTGYFARVAVFYDRLENDGSTTKRCALVFVALRAGVADCATLSKGAFKTRRHDAVVGGAPVRDTDEMVHVPLVQLLLPTARAVYNPHARDSDGRVIDLHFEFGQILRNEKLRVYLRRVHDNVLLAARPLPISSLSVDVSRHSNERKQGSPRGSGIVDVGVAADRGVRENMEDSHVVEMMIESAPHYSFVGVFDGHGGSDAASAAAFHLLRCITLSPSWRKDFVNNKSIVSALKEGFLKFDEQLREEGAAAILHPSQTRLQKERDTASGTTACVCVVTPTHIICANVGDSHAVLVSGCKAEKLSRDHTPSNSDEHLRIIAAGGAVVTDDCVIVSNDSHTLRFFVEENKLYRNCNNVTHRVRELRIKVAVQPKTLEIIRFLLKHGGTAEEREKLFAAMDVDRSDLISLNEFSVGVLKYIPTIRGDASIPPLKADAVELRAAASRAETDSWDAETWMKLGRILESGLGGKVDRREAFNCFQKASEGTSPAALAALNTCGNCYRVGHGVDVDLLKAIDNYKSAAEKGSASARANLANCEEIQAAFHALDSDRSGEISRKEFRNALELLHDTIEIVSTVESEDGRLVESEDGKPTVFRDHLPLKVFQAVINLARRDDMDVHLTGGFEDFGKPHVGPYAFCFSVPHGGLVLKTTSPLNHLSVTRAFGHFDFKSQNLPPEAHQVTCAPSISVHKRSSADDFLVLATDGVLDFVGVDDTVEFLRGQSASNEPAVTLADNIVFEALNRGATDNACAIVCRLAAPDRITPMLVGDGGEEGNGGGDDDDATVGDTDSSDADAAADASLGGNDGPAAATAVAAAHPPTETRPRWHRQQVCSSQGWVLLFDAPWAASAVDGDGERELRYFRSNEDGTVEVADVVDVATAPNGAPQRVTARERLDGALCVRPVDDGRALVLLPGKTWLVGTPHSQPSARPNARKVARAIEIVPLPGGGRVRDARWVPFSPNVFVVLDEKSILTFHAPADATEVILMSECCLPDFACGHGGALSWGADRGWEKCVARCVVTFVSPSLSHTTSNPRARTRPALPQALPLPRDGGGRPFRHVPVCTASHCHPRRRVVRARQ
jgi:serine/threonine protein phosphatase PrpC/Ca2+-binding EF-hand superfamily protein